MKTINEYIAGLILLIIIPNLTACSDDSYDVKGSNLNHVYINLNRWSEKDNLQNVFVYDVLRTPVSTIVENCPEVVKVGVRSTKVASEDIKVTLDIDKTNFVEGYSIFPDGVNVTMDKHTLTIPAGSMQSTDSVKLEIEDGKWSEFVDDSYLLPLKITSVSNAKLSGEHSSAYIVVNSSYSNCVAGATSVEGALISDRSAWTATLDGVDTGKNLFDGNTRTYNRGNVMVVDLQSEVEAISGFKMTFYSQSYCLSYVTVYTSNDGENYECQGAVNVARSASQYIRFYGSISARYIKLELSPYNSTRGVRFAEFDVYQNK